MTKQILRPRLRSLFPVILIGLLAVLTGCNESVERLISDATALRQTGNIPTAVIKINAVLARDPRNVPARLLAAGIYIDLERGDAALGLLIRAQQDGASEESIASLRAKAGLVAHHYKDVIQQTAALPPGLSRTSTAELVAARAGALTALGRTVEARAALQDALADDAHSVYVRIIAARLALGANDLETARREYAAAMAVAPGDRRLRQLRADIAYAAQDYSEAADLYSNILATERWNDTARGELAATQLAQNNLTAAVDTVDAVLKNPDLRQIPKHPVLYYIRALAAFRQQDYATAQSNSATVVSLVPDFEAARLMAGVCSFELHQYEQAYYYLSPYVATNPGDRQARKLFAQTQLALGRAADAMQTLAPLADKPTDDQELLTLLGTASARGGDVVGAERYLKLLVTETPDDNRLRTELGIAEITAGDPKAAAHNLEEAVRSHPDASAPQLPLFVAFMQTKDYENAHEIAENFVKAEPRSPLGHLLAALAYMGQGRVADGRSALLQARAVEPGDVSAESLLAKLALTDGRADEARRYYQEAITAHPSSIQTYLELADLDLRLGRADAAEVTLREGVEANPTDSALAVALARAQLSGAKIQEALTGAQTARKKFPKSPELLDVIGHAELAMGHSGEALTVFRDLVNAAPGAAWAHTALAEAYLAQYTPDNPQWGAVNEALEAVQLDPQDVGAKAVLTRALIMHGRLAEAGKLVDELKIAQPDSLTTVQLEGQLAEKQHRPADAAAAFSRAAALTGTAESLHLAEEQQRDGKLQDAIKTLQAAVEAHPHDIQTHKMLADAYVTANQLADAAAEYRALVTQQPDNPVMQNNLAWILLKSGEAKAALTFARNAVALRPNSADFLDTLGTILLKQGDPGEALGSLDAAWRNSGDRPEIGFHLSQALAAAGDKERAVTVLQQLLAGSDPFADRAQAKQLLSSLGG